MLTVLLSKAEDGAAGDADSVSHDVVLDFALRLVEKAGDQWLMKAVAGQVTLETSPWLLVSVDGLTRGCMSKTEWRN